MREKAGQWSALAVCLIVLGLGVSGFELGPEPTSQAGREKIEVVNWNWKQSVNGRILAIFGSVRNPTSKPFDQVILELRTEDDQKKVLARHAINVGRVDAKTEKAFREDVPRTGQEAMGFVEVRSLIK